MFELHLLCPEDRVDVLSEALEALDALSVSVEDADAETVHEQALFGEPGMPPPKEGWQRSKVVALFTKEAEAREAALLLAAQDFFEACEVMSLEAVPDQDWVRLTQSQFAPVEITPEFWIVPTWHEPPLQAREIIRLDPGLAFGTGTHPTTRMCLRWTSTALNAQANEVSLNAGLPELAQGTYQTVVANILATPLKVLAPLLCSHVEAGGHLVLAGILERQEKELIQAYAPHIELSVADREDGWILMTAQRGITA